MKDIRVSRFYSDHRTIVSLKGIVSQMVLLQVTTEPPWVHMISIANWVEIMDDTERLVVETFFEMVEGAMWHQLSQFESFVLVFNRGIDDEQTFAERGSALELNHRLSFLINLSKWW